jgi:hypothetical protein
MNAKNTDDHPDLVAALVLGEALPTKILLPHWNNKNWRNCLSFTFVVLIFSLTSQGCFDIEIDPLLNRSRK